MGILTIDDRDPLLSYSPPGAWGQGGVSAEYNSTTTFAKDPGLTVTLTFSGTSIGVYGTIVSLSNGESPPQTSYVVDNGSATNFTASLTNGTQYEQRFYNSGTLSAGTHTLLITLLSTNSSFFLDYIQVIPMDLAVSSSSLSSSSVASSSSVSTQTKLSSSFGSTPTTSSTASSPSSQDSSSPKTTKAESSLHMSTIIGVSLGVLALLIIIFFTILFMQKRRRDRKFRKMLNSQKITTQSLWTRYTPPRSNSSITPFITAQYQPIHDDTHLDLIDSHTTERVAPFNAPPTPPQKDIIAQPSLKSKGYSHSPSSSQHVIPTQDSRINASTYWGSANSSLNQASSSSRLAPQRSPFDLPPPQYDN